MTVVLQLYSFFQYFFQLATFFSIVLATLGLLCFHINIRISCQYSQNNLLGFCLGCVESVDRVGENWQFNIESIHNQKSLYVDSFLTTEYMCIVYANAFKLMALETLFILHEEILQ